MAKPIIQFDSKAFEKAAKRAPNLVRKSLAFRMEKIGDEFERLMDRRFTAKPTGEFYGNETKNQLINRTGRLRRTMNSKVIGSKAGSATDLVLRSSIGDASTGHYVFTQEYGATIRPKRARALTVPLPDNLTTAGRVRFEKASSIPGLFLLKKDGKAFLVRESASEGELDFMFILLSRVEIPARLGFRKTWRTKALREFRTRELNEGVQKAYKLVFP